MGKFKMVQNVTVLEGGPNYTPKAESGNVHFILVKHQKDQVLTFPNSAGPGKVTLPGYSVWHRVESIGYARF